MNYPFFDIQFLHVTQNFGFIGFDFLFIVHQVFELSFHILDVRLDFMIDFFRFFILKILLFIIILLYSFGIKISEIVFSLRDSEQILILIYKCVIFNQVSHRLFKLILFLTEFGRLILQFFSVYFQFFLFFLASRSFFFQFLLFVIIFSAFSFYFFFFQPNLSVLLIRFFLFVFFLLQFFSSIFQVSLQCFSLLFRLRNRIHQLFSLNLEFR